VVRRSQNVKLALRFTAAVLLATIAWGSTVEVTHGHAAAGTNLSAQTVRNSSEPRATETSPKTFLKEDEPARSSSRSNTSSTCLICQLHHNLATTLLAQLVTADAMHSQSARTCSSAPVHFLEFTTAQPGRAPPVIL
jgi:hypothetical protein